MPLWTGTKRKKKMQLQATLMMWTLITKAADSINVVFFDPFESDLITEVPQDGLLW